MAALLRMTCLGLLVWVTDLAATELAPWVPIGPYGGRITSVAIDPQLPTPPFESIPRTI